MSKLIDRALPDIIASMSAIIASGRVKGQFARDLEKLCVAALRTPPEVAEGGAPARLEGDSNDEPSL